MKRRDYKWPNSLFMVEFHQNLYTADEVGMNNSIDDIIKE
jgi:hypothetical protein